MRSEGQSRDALFDAVYSGDVAKVEEVLCGIEARADLQDDLGRTALHIACSLGSSWVTREEEEEVSAASPFPGGAPGHGTRAEREAAAES